MTDSHSTIRTMSALASMSLIVLSLVACSTPGPSTGTTPTTAAPSAAPEEAVGEASEIGVLADMTPSECAVAGSPWNIDDPQLDRDASLALIATDPAIASAGMGSGNYQLDFSADGRVRVTTVGYSLRATLKEFVEPTGFGHVTALADPGMAEAEWSDIDETGSVISFIDWTNGILDRAPVLDDGSAYPGVWPAWQVQGRTGVELRCDEDGTGLWLISTTPGYLDVHFIR